MGRRGRLRTMHISSNAAENNEILRSICHRNATNGRGEAANRCLKTDRRRNNFYASENQV
jgi:hypothetical protein